MASKNIVIIGAGDVAWNLGHQLKKAGHSIVQVYNRTLDKGQRLADELDADFTNKLEQVDPNADIYLLAVSDHGIDDIILGLRLPGKVVAHTSGAVPLRGMEHISKNCGIFYPLQTLTRGREVDFAQVPMLIEASNDKVKAELTELAASISKRVDYMDSHKRRALHVAAVFVNNFTNYLYSIADDVVQREGLDFSLLNPLMQETLNKLKYHRPVEVQTGPAKRADYRTIEEHLSYLGKNDAYREVYLVLTESIMAAHKAVEIPDEEPEGEDWDFGDEFDADFDEQFRLPEDDDEDDL